jgi:hypothetical protein
MVIWDGGGNGGLSDLGQRLLGVLPPMHDLAKTVGLELPEFLGRATPKENTLDSTAALQKKAPK